MKCEYCNKEHDGSYGSGRFCSVRCARVFSTSRKRQEINSKVSKTIANNSIANYYKNPKYCKICNNVIPYEYRRRLTCSDDCKALLKQQQLVNISVSGGLASAKAQQKRSKNEIAFCNKCEEYFGIENVLHNEPMFNGWDADIILPKYKLAILWNGRWHYQKITKQHSLAQVQNRDRLKINEIRKCGYTEYIIEDLGKYSYSKVEKEFNTLLQYLELGI